MEEKKIIIAGGGISGLAAAYYLSFVNQRVDFTLLEEKSSLGGWLQTCRDSRFFCEIGARTFKVSRCFQLLQFAEDLGVEKKIILSKKEAENRFIWFRNRLHQFPKNPLSFLCSPLTRPFILSLFTEWLASSQKDGDESIADFFMRRFDARVLNRLIDPLVQGIYAGDVSKLSMISCFPLFKQWERLHGSLTKGFFSHCLTRYDKPKNSYPFPPQALFSFEGGMNTLISAIENKLAHRFSLNEKIEAITFEKDHISIQTQHKSFKVDHFASALPAYVLGDFFKISDPRLSQMFFQIEYQDLYVVNLAYVKRVLPVKGFGYLVPTVEKAAISGVLFDSEVFPQHNRHEEETRLTVMMKDRGYREEQALQLALGAVKQHLHIDSLPADVLVTKVKNGIPQYTVGHEKRVQLIEEYVKEKYPRLSLIGNYLHGVSVNDCVALSKKWATSIMTN